MGGALAGPPALAESANQRFDAAIELAQRGQPQAAAEALVRLADELPDDPFADDALSEAALLYEQTLRDPEQAARLLQRLVERYPQSRLTRRAQSRLDRLRLGLQSGSEALTQYQATLGELPKLTPRAQAERLRTLLVKYPDFSLRDDVRLQLATAAARAGQIEAALDELVRLERDGRTEALRTNARLARAELLLESGRLAEAGAIDGGAAFEKKLRGAKWRRRLVVGSSGLLVALVLLSLWRLGRSGLVGLFREPPLETLFFLPIGVVFSLAGLTENRLVAWATLLLSLGGLIEVTLFAGLARLTWRRRRLAVALLGVGLLLATVALFVVVIERLGLSGLVVETLRHGPER